MLLRCASSWASHARSRSTTRLLSLLLAMTCLLLAPSAFAATVSGTITLQGYAAPTTQTWDIAVDATYTTLQASLPPQTIHLTIPANTDTGSYSLTVPAGKFFIGFKGVKWLRSQKTVDTTNASVSGLFITLLAGDANNDNSVDVFDFFILSDAYDSTPGNSNWDERADFNCDGSVDVFDYFLLSDNYDLVGDPYPVLAPTNKGTDFWLVFPDTYTEGNFEFFQTLLTSEFETSGQVQFPTVSAPVTFQVHPGQTTKVDGGDAAKITSSDLVESKGIHLTSAQPVSVDIMEYIYTASSAYLSLPTSFLGTDYIVTAFPNTAGYPSQFSLVATQANTSVTITPTATTTNHVAGISYTISLNQGQTYQLQASTDLTGTTITSNNPIAVFGGNKCAYVPSSTYSACNPLVQQLTPTNTWGIQFLTVSFAGRLIGDTFRFAAANNGTHISVNGMVVATLNRGQFYQQLLSGTNFITSDYPISVVQFANSSAFDVATGDPAMLLVPPISGYLNRYTVAVPPYFGPGFNNGANYINLVVPTSEIGNIYLDGNPVAASAFTSVSTTGFSAARLTVTVAAHRLYSTSGAVFGASVYGFSVYDAYAFPAGMAATSP